MPRNKLALILILLLFGSCSITKRALDKRDWINRNKPSVLLEYCASIAKVDTLLLKSQDSIILPGKLIPIFLPGKDSLITDTFYVKCPDISIPKPDTLRITTIDTSGIGLLRHQLNVKEEEKQKGINWQYLMGGIALAELVTLLLLILLKKK